MSATNDVPFTQWASIDVTEKIVAVTPSRGYRRRLHEDEPDITYLKPDVPDATLGQAVLEALNGSRFMHPHTDRGFFEADRIVAADNRWDAKFMQRGRYKTKRDAYKTMRYCLAERREGRISIRPHKRGSKPRYWWDLPLEKTVVIPETNDPGIVGAAARLALNNCE